MPRGVWVRTARHRKIISDSLKGVGHPCTSETREKIRKTLKRYFATTALSTETRHNISAAQRRLVKEGRHHLWKGGLTKRNVLIRQTLRYRLWRESVFERDNWTCVKCGVRGVKLHAHHLRPFAKHPDLRFAVDNGATLCVPCHKKTDSYLRRGLL